MFGSEQRFVQSRFLLRFIYKIFGEFRYPIRLRGAILSRSLPGDFYPKTVWDAGCGEGQSSFWLSKRFSQAQIIGTDIKKENVERCDRIARNQNSNNVTFLEKDVFEGVPQRVNLIVCSEVLEHIDNYGDALMRFSEFLEPSGLLVIHTPADNAFQSPTWGLRRFMHSEKKEAILREKGQDHVRSGFDLADLVSQINILGFQVLNKQYTFGFIAMFAHTIYEWTRSRSKAWQIITFWPLLILGYLDMSLSLPVGAGVLIVARKK